MRVAVGGSSVAVAGLRGNLRHAGYVVTEESPVYSVTVNDTAVPYIVVDIPDAIFGRLVTHAVGELAMHGGVYVQHRGGNLDDRSVTIQIPVGRDQDVLAVERGVVRALDQTLAIMGQQARRARLLPQSGAADPALLVKHLVGIWDDLGTQLGEEAQRLRASFAAALSESERQSRTQQAEDMAKLLEKLDRVALLMHRENHGAEIVAQLDILVQQTRPRHWWQWGRHA